MAQDFLKSVSFMDADARQIDQRRALAAALQGQSMTPIQSQPSGRLASPIHPFQALAKVGQAYAGSRIASDADKAQADLASKYRATLSDTLQRGNRAMSGTPASSETIVDEQAAGGEGAVATINAPAVAPDQGRAASIYLEHPATSGLGMQMSAQQAQDARRSAILAQILGEGAQAAPAPDNPMVPGPNASVMAGSGSFTPEPNTQQPAPQRQSRIPGVNPMAAALMLSGDQSLAALGKTVQDANKPIAAREGAPVINPADGRILFYAPKLEAGMAPQFSGGQITGVQNIPGFVPALTERTQATEGVRAGLDIVTVPDGRGGTQQMTRSQAAQLFGGFNGGARQPGQQQRVPLIGGGGSPGYIRPEAARAGESKFSEKVGAEFGDIYAGLIRADLAAPQTIAKYERLGSLLKNVNAGKFTGTTASLKAAAKSFGFDLESLGVGDDVAPTQAAIALSNMLALELRNPAGGAGMPGALSDQDRNFLVQSIPGIENDPAAIPLMVDYRVKLAKREQQVAKMARAYRRKNNGNFDEGFYDELAEWSAKNPLFPADSAPKPKPKPGAGNGGFRVLGEE